MNGGSHWWSPHLSSPSFALESGQNSRTATAMKSKRGLLPVSWSGAVARRAPYLSSILIILVGLYVAYQSWAGLATHAAKRARSG